MHEFPWRARRIFWAKAASAGDLGRVVSLRTKLLALEEIARKRPISETVACGQAPT